MLGPCSRWQKIYLLWFTATGIVICGTTSLIRTRNEGIMFLVICAVATYMLALAACVKAFTKDK